MLFYAIFFNLSIVYCSLQCMRAWAICISGIHKRHSRCGFYGQDANCKAADAPLPPPPPPNMVSLVLCGVSCLLLGPTPNKKKQTEEKAKVVAAVW